MDNKPGVYFVDGPITDEGLDGMAMSDRSMDVHRPYGPMRDYPTPDEAAQIIAHIYDWGMN